MPRKEQLQLGLGILGIVAVLLGIMAYKDQVVVSMDMIELLLVGVPLAVYVTLKAGLGIDLVVVFKRLIGRGPQAEFEAAEDEDEAQG